MQNSLEAVRRQFRTFPKDYSMAPYWYWNDDMREEEIVRQLDEMKRQHVLEPALMPGAGLLVPYLSPEYFEAYRFALKEVRRRGMHLWIYDDYNWPSGMAGGRVLEEYPEYCHTGCRLYQYPVTRRDSRQVRIEVPAGRLIWAQAERRSDGKRVELLDRCDEFALRWTAGPGEWDIVLCVIHPVQRTQESVTGSRWASNLPGYVDVMNREAMAKYIELVHEGHYRAAPEYFGTTVRGFLTDEASVWFDSVIKGGRQTLSASHHAPFGTRTHAPGNPILDGFVRSVPWSRGFQHIFRERVGYDLRPHLPTLLRPAPAHRAFFHDYFKLVSDLYAESYAEQIGAWCGRHKVAFSGHWDEGPSNGDYYRKVAPMQVPGIDLLGSLVATHNLMPLPRMVATIAKMKGRPRVLAETYGVTPWTFELSNKIQSADFLTVLGVNLHAPIDAASSFRSFRKHTSNPPGFYHASNWRYQRCLSDHIARLCCVTATGRSTASVALVYGSSQAVSDTLAGPVANGLLEKHLRSVFTAYLDAQIEADVIPETGLREGRWAGGRLAYPGAVYRTLALPHLHILEADTVRRLAGFVRTGGTLLVHGSLPRMDPRGRDLSPLWRTALAASVLAEGDEVCRLDIGTGRVWLIPPDAIERQVTVSTAYCTDQRFNLFDGTDSLFVISPPYPLWLALDLGAPHTLAGFSLTLEAIKQDMTYAYDLQVSDDGRAWRTIGSYRRRGLVHQASLPGVKARHVRLAMRGADDARRKFGLSDLTLRVRDAQGVERRWMPDRPRPAGLAALLPAERPPVEFHQDGSLAGDLVGATRACGGALIMAVVNRADVRRRLEARVRPGYALEAWDLDTGKAADVPLSAGCRVPVDFEPYEARVLVLYPKKAAARRPAAALARDWSVLAESAGPWPFRMERANVLPLTLGNLRMADPMRPGAWLPSKGGRIPEALRFVSVLHFSCDLEFEAVTGREELLVEEGIFAALKVNGIPLEDSAFRRNRYLDAFGLGAPIGRRLKRGRNTIAGMYFPEMYERLTQGPMFHYPVLQPTLDAFVLGPFAVTQARAVKPAGRLTARPWQEQGYPYYSGTGVYTVRFDQLARAGETWLEADVRGGVMDVRAGTEPVGVRIAAPYRVDVSRFVRRGRTAFEIRVTNTTGTLMRAQGVGYYGGSTNVYASGLAGARLVQPCGGAAGATQPGRPVHDA